MNQCVLVQGLDTPGPSKSVPGSPKRHPVPPNGTRRGRAFYTTPVTASWPLVSGVGVLLCPCARFVLPAPATKWQNDVDMTSCGRRG